MKKVDYHNYDVNGAKIIKPIDKLKNGEKIWLAICECGKDFKIKTSYITLNKKVHCGCKTKLRIKKEVVNINKKHGISLIKECVKIDNKKMYKLVCRCGNEFFASASDIGKGYKKHCGCSRLTAFKINGITKTDITGEYFNGNLCVGKKDKEWVFRCMCGNFFYQTSHQVSNRPHYGCGCNTKINKKLKLKENDCHYISEEFLYGKKIINLICKCGRFFSREYCELYKNRNIFCNNCDNKPFNNIIEFNSSKKTFFFDKIKSGAKVRNLSVEINSDYCIKLLELQNYKCSISGVQIYLAVDKYNLGTASLDRIDNNIGYIDGNVRWLHKDVNFMRKTMSDEELIQWCKTIYLKSME